MSNKYLNLGCGGTFFDSWTNIDFTSNSPHVQEHNLLNGIPFDANKFEVVYHSHVLEHFSKSDGVQLIKECHRVLEKEGVLRIAIPDLEQIVRSYISCLDNVAKDDSKQNEANYDWSIIELLDQLIRHKGGGEMLSFWNQDEIVNEDFVVHRVGHEFSDYRQYFLNAKVIGDEQKGSVLKRICNKLFHLLSKVLVVFKHEENKFEKVGKVRLSGEVHQWMYDRHSITRLLKSVGFKDVRITTAFESDIPNWADFMSLDAVGNEKRKPDSLYIEAIK